jgi:hypothetical protein
MRKEAGRLQKGSWIEPVYFLLLLAWLTGCSIPGPSPSPRSISGIYPRLAVFNGQDECGIGAVVPWAGVLWAVTYSPHRPRGSDDKLYVIDRDLRLSIRPESIGGTPANRMIHRESEQLIIGPYFIDKSGIVRVVSYEEMPGRLTATVRHLTDPENKVYFLTMEEGLYEVDVHTLAVTEVYPDGHARLDDRGTDDLPHLPGYHGKGGYTGQGRVVYSNNGELPTWEDADIGRAAGCLAEWDGNEWTVVERRQYTEVTGPGGLEGSFTAEDPIWAAGWDHRSVILMLRQDEAWTRFRLPKASVAYDGIHGWHTEWPRIRRIGDDRMLMTMHGMFWDFPPTFGRNDTAGIRPLSSYLKMVVDFCAWEGRLVLACNDASRFDNPLVSRAQSNFWFVNPEKLTELGPAAGSGGLWLTEDVAAANPSDPFLIAGFDHRVLHLAHETAEPVIFNLEIDPFGSGDWVEYARCSVPPHGYVCHIFPLDLAAEWIRIRPDRDCLQATAFLNLGAAGAAADVDPGNIFRSLPSAVSAGGYSFGVIRPAGPDGGSLEFAASRLNEAGETVKAGYFVLSPELDMTDVRDDGAERALLSEARITTDFVVDEASVILTDEKGRRFRLPKGDLDGDAPTSLGPGRGIREVVTERSLLNAHGSFYELPREISGGVAGIKPVCTHNRRIYDFCSWRGLLVVSGVDPTAPKSGHLVRNPDRTAGLWLGTVDDLWRLGKPRGRGGPWFQTPISAGSPSDPYLMRGYDRKRLILSQDGPEAVTVGLEVDITGTGVWKEYETLLVEPHGKETYAFPSGYEAHWIRLTADRDCRATAVFVYE